MTFILSKRSLSKLEGVHPDLVAVVHRCLEITKIDFTVLEGIRTPERQQELYENGASDILDSRHLVGCAVDIAPYINGEVSWHWPHYFRLEVYMHQAAEELEIPIEWGGHWVLENGGGDGPHWQLPRSKYPDTPPSLYRFASTRPPS